MGQTIFDRRADQATWVSASVHAPAYPDSGRYFLARRDWHHLNVPMAQGFPFFLLKLNPPEEGDYGFDEMHEYGDDDHDFLRAVLKVRPREMTRDLISDKCPDTFATKKRNPNGP